MKNIVRTVCTNGEVIGDKTWAITVDILFIIPESESAEMIM